jgi:hypothetical protein
MSIAGLALRTITVKALRGQTMAGGAVEPSAIEPIEGKIKEAAQPFILVFTDGGMTQESSRDGIGRDMLGTQLERSLSFEVGVATKVPAQTVTVDGEDGPVELVIAIPPTDEGFEITIDLITHQIVAALQAGTSSWAELWRRFVLRITGIRSERGASDEKGVRFAARRFALTLDTVADPTPGAPLADLWADVVAAFEADAELANIGKLIRGVSPSRTRESSRHTFRPSRRRRRVLRGTV